MPTYLNRIAEIRNELVRAARSGEFPSYAEFGSRLGIPAQGPWNAVLDRISVEETKAGRPDITFVLRKAATGYPGQIGFVTASGRPTADQRKLAHDKVQEVIDHYCSGTPNPFPI